MILTNVGKAFLVASKAHATQSYGIFPYIYHVMQVSEIAKELEYSEDVQVACMLHDVLEDSDVTYNDLKKEFGKKVADTVYAVTDELAKTRTERKLLTADKIRKNRDALLVKLCDRIANVQNSKKHDHSMFEKYREENEDFTKLFSDWLRDTENADIKRGIMKLREAF